MTKGLKGCWFMYPVDEPIPSRLCIFTGDVHHRKPVRWITQAQAKAYAKHYGHRGTYSSWRDSRGKWHDVRLVGDSVMWNEGKNEETTE